MGKVKADAFDNLDKWLDSLTPERRNVFEERVESGPRESDPLGVMRDMKAGKYKKGGAVKRYKNGGCVMKGRGGSFKGIS